MVLISKKVAAGFHRIPMGSAVFRVGSFCCLKVQQKNAWGEHLSGEPRKYREKNSWANNCNTLPTFSTRSALVVRS